MERCVDRAVGSGSALKHLVALLDADNSGRGNGVARVDNKAVERVALLAGNRNSTDQTLEIAILDDLLLVSQNLELLECLLELLVIERVAQLMQALLERMAAGMLAEHDGVLRDADGFRSRSGWFRCCSRCRSGRHGS